MFEHKNHPIDGFTKKYRITRLVYFEETNNVESAILREKQIKSWRRDKKLNLIVAVNPAWDDLAESWFEKQIPRCARNDRQGQIHDRQGQIHDGQEQIHDRQEQVTGRGAS